ncbi:MAG: BrnT family toxin [Bradyrhizobium sp.]|nr:BrnT family toxin [Bradyrhizobium sp.]
MAEDNPGFELLDPTGFEWDDVKSDANLLKHGITFDDASEVFYGPIIIRKSTRNDEERWLAIGISHDRLMSVIFTRRNDLIRIISARRPRPDEKRAYRNAKMGRPPEGQD